MALTLANIRSRVTARLGLDSTSSGSEATLLDSYVNDGYEDFLQRTACWVERSTMTTTAGTADYDMDQDIMQIVEMYATGASDGEDVSMERVSPIRILEARRFSDVSAAPARWFATQGHNMLMLWPTPDAVDTLTVYYVPRPSTLSASTDSASLIPPQYAKALEFYALAEMADYDDDQSSAMGQSYRARYEELVVRARREASRMGTRRLPPATVGRRRRWVMEPGRDDGS